MKEIQVLRYLGVTKKGGDTMLTKVTISKQLGKSTVVTVEIESEGEAKQAAKDAVEAINILKEK